MGQEVVSPVGISQEEEEEEEDDGRTKHTGLNNCCHEQKRKLF